MFLSKPWVLVKWIWLAENNTNFILFIKLCFLKLLKKRDTSGKFQQHVPYFKDIENYIPPSFTVSDCLAFSIIFEIDNFNISTLYFETHVAALQFVILVVCSVSTTEVLNNIVIFGWHYYWFICVFIFNFKIGLMGDFIFAFSSSFWTSPTGQHKENV